MTTILERVTPVISTENTAARSHTEAQISRAATDSSTARKPRREAVSRPAGFLRPRYRLRLRRMAVLRVLAHPVAAARLLDVLADEADVGRYGIGVIIKACAEHHVPRSPFDW